MRENKLKTTQQSCKTGPANCFADHSGLTPTVPRGWLGLASVPDQRLKS